jgi:hypothetical protein
VSVELKCPIHPRYKALRKPVYTCFCCDAIYSAASSVRGYEILLRNEKAAKS